MVVLTDDSNYKAIGDAIRTKNGTTEAYKPSEMAGAIEAISAGGGGTFSSVALSRITAAYADNAVTLSGIDTDGLVAFYIGGGGMRSYAIGANGGYGTLVTVFGDLKNGVCGHSLTGFQNSTTTAMGRQPNWTVSTVDATSLKITSATASDLILAGFTTDIGATGIQGVAVYCK